MEEKLIHDIDHSGLLGIAVTLRQGEDGGALIRRFKKKVSKSGIIQESRRRMFFEKPSDFRRRKKREQVRRLHRTLSKVKKGKEEGGRSIKATRES